MKHWGFNRNVNDHFYQKRQIYCNYLLHLSPSLKLVHAFPLHHAICTWHCGCVDLSHIKWPTHTSALLDEWMLYFSAVNELRRKELAEKLVKPFAHQRKLCRRAWLWFYHCHACRSGLGLGTYILNLSYRRSHTRTYSNCTMNLHTHTNTHACIHRQGPTLLLYIRLHRHRHTWTWSHYLLFSSQWPILLPLIFKPNNTTVV